MTVTVYTCKKNAPASQPGRFIRSNCNLEHVPQELVVDLVVELYFLAFDERA